MRTPRPTPPATALMINGYRTCLATSSAHVSPYTGPSLPVGNIGRPAFWIAFQARALSPGSLTTSGSGPMKLMWHAWDTSARCALSDRNLYPGWIASVPVTSAALMIAATLR
jgi:hypothetical protein